VTAPTDVPAWGTTPAAPGVLSYTVVGFYGYNGQRFLEQVVAASAREAEDLVTATLGVQRADDGEPARPQVCGVLAVFDGQIRSMDGYATYLDPALEDDVTPVRPS